MNRTERLKAFVRRPRILAFLGAFSVWTGFWVVAAIQDVMTQTTLGQGQVGPTLEVWEALEVLVVSAYSGVRWAAGVALAVGLLAMLRFRGTLSTSS